MRWYQSWYEAALILAGKHSLHRAWQLGHDHGTDAEYKRLIKKRGYVGEVAYLSKAIAKGEGK